MSLNFANNDLQVRTQFLKRLHTMGFHLGANLNSFDYSFVEYTRFNTPQISSGNFKLGDTGRDPANTYYLGDFQLITKNDRSSGKFSLHFTDDIIYDLLYSNLNTSILTYNVNNILFDQALIYDVTGFRVYFHFVGVKITMKI